MAEVDTAPLQRLYGGRYIARRDGEVIASAETYRELSEQLDQMAVSWDRLVIEYVDPLTSIGVY
jgi:Family of unknown function (DUF5678)